ncbi:transposase family protein [Nonomuraea sp. NPDC002799]
MACPVCGSPSSRVHGWHWRRLHDRPVSERAMMLDLHLRRLACAEVACPRRTFREHVPDLAVRYARRTPSLTALIGGLAVKLAGRAASAALARRRRPRPAHRRVGRRPSHPPRTLRQRRHRHPALPGPAWINKPKTEGLY